MIKLPLSAGRDTVKTPFCLYYYHEKTLAMAGSAAGEQKPPAEISAGGVFFASGSKDVWNFTGLPTS
jgi:hypothetical protein